MLRILISTLLFAMLITAPAAAGEADPSDAALTFVAGFSDNHLSEMLSRIGGQSSAMSVLYQRHGEPVVAVFDSEINKAMVKYGPAWQRNLALTWTPLLTDDELLSLAIAGAQSPFTGKYLSLRGTAGQTMQQLSQGLFHEALTEVVTNAATELAHN